MIYGLPWEGWAGLACGVLFLLVFFYGVCKSAGAADEVDREIFEAECEVRRARRRQRFDVAWLESVPVREPKRTVRR